VKESFFSLMRFSSWRAGAMTAFTLARPRCATSTRALILRIFDHFFLLCSIIDGCYNRL
jgi:hypothetical protein